MSELIQLEIGISTNRYFPAIGTAGFDRVSVNGYNREPCPPPKIMAKTSFFHGYFFNVWLNSLYCCATFSQEWSICMIVFLVLSKFLTSLYKSIALVIE